MKSDEKKKYLVGMQNDPGINVSCFLNSHNSIRPTADMHGLRLKLPVECTMHSDDDRSLSLK